MALINCPECSKEVSDKAVSCPNCGIAIKQSKLQSLLEAGKKQIPDYNTNFQKPKLNKSLFSNKKVKLATGAIAAFVLILIIAIAGSSGNNKSPSSMTPPPQNISVSTPNNTHSPTPQPTPQPTPDPLPPVEWIDTGIIIEYDDNLFLNKYDIRISINNAPIGIMEQGNIEFFEFSLPEDIHEISLSEFGNDENITTDTFEVISGSYNYFFIKTRNSGIEIERRDTFTYDEILLLVGVPDDVITTTPTITPSPTPIVIYEIITVDNNKDFAALLDTHFPGQNEIEAFVEQYNGRTIEFDGHIFMSSRQFHGMRETPPTSLHVFIWNGDSEDANINGDHNGPEYFMDRVRIRDFPLIEREDTNVRIVATVDDVGYVYLDDKITIISTYIILTPISIDRR